MRGQGYCFSCSHSCAFYVMGYLLCEERGQVLLWLHEEEGIGT